MMRIRGSRKTWMNSLMSMAFKRRNIRRSSSESFGGRRRIIAEEYTASSRASIQRISRPTPREKIPFKIETTYRLGKI